MRGGQPRGGRRPGLRGPPELALEEAEDGSDPVLARRAAWQVERARASIGVDADGNVLENRGYGKKLAAVRRKVERRRATVKQSIDAQLVEIQGLAKAAWSHLPLQSLTVMEGEKTVRSIVATNAQAASIYHADRGFGWVKAPVTAPSKSALVIRGQAQWRCDLPPGPYRLAFVLGDTVEWNCMSVKQAGRPLVAVNRLVPMQTVTETVEVEVGDDGLLLDIGLKHKAILASESGAVKYQTFMTLGEPIRNNPPALYLTPDARLTVRFLVHHLQLPFFEEGATAEHRLMLQNSLGDWIPAGRVKITDDPVAFFTREDDDDEERPEERTAREVTVDVPKEYTKGFAFATHVLCRAEARPKEDAIAIPSFLVHEGEDGLRVRRDGAPIQVEGSRYDQHFILQEGIAPGDRLAVPIASGTAPGANRFTGEVVSGAAVPMVVPTRSWARIEDLVPHGSKVKEGDDTG
ncbi:MAG: hypothetical protein AAF492_20980 [Verrucomicrobiota bacterium]